MMDPNKFKHDSSRYERPNKKFRCGRGATWGKPCEFGPHVSGRCGGMSECRPAKVGERWECRRSSIAGGPCENGPNPDGSCCNTHPPCRPRRSLRSQRAILAASAFALVIAIIAVMLTLGGDGKARDAVIQAGDLTGGHANFTSATGCTSCHSAHDEDAGDWFLAAFHEDDMTEQCLDCHTFGGDARLGHNAKFAAKAQATECVMCHTEHKGEDANIKLMSDTQCSVCHEKEIESFSADHPQFSATFPHDRRTSIQFDHVSHLSKHFADQRFTKRAPEDCTSCHAVDTAARAVEPAGFDQTCAQCHTNVIKERELVVLRLPEFEENMIDGDAVMEACGPTLETWEMVRDNMAEITEALESGDEVELAEIEEEEYEAVSLEEGDPISAFLLGMAADDVESYSEPMQEFILRLIEEGPAPLAELVDEHAGKEVSPILLSGLNAELVKRVACAWAANIEYEAPADNALGGWHGDALELRYAPIGHGDAVAKGWVNFALNTKVDEDDDNADATEAMHEAILSPKEGIGACTKCHAISETGNGTGDAAGGTAGDDATDGGTLQAEWRYRPSNARPYTTYSHGAHITLLDPAGVNMMDPESGCRTCHKVNEEAPYREAFEQRDPYHFQSSFSPIDQGTCAQCHSEGQVQQDCQLCHVYHADPGFDLQMVKDDEAAHED